METIKREMASLGEIEEINEDSIYEIYKEAIKEEHNKPFKDFTSENRDAYMRLKFRAINQTKPKFPVFP